MLAASCQNAAYRATLVAMAQENYLSQTPAASALFLREEEVRRGIEYLFFAHGALWRGVDARLADAGIGRAHHRALYFIARQPGISVSASLALLGITKQSLGRVLRELESRGFVTACQGGRDRRQKILHLTEAGKALETSLFIPLRDAMGRAYTAAGQQAVTGFWHVNEALIPARDRERVAALGKAAD